MTTDEALKLLKSGKILGFYGQGDCEIFQWKHGMVVVDGWGKVYRCNNFDDVAPYLKLITHDNSYFKSAISACIMKQKGVLTDYSGEIIQVTEQHEDTK